MQKTLLKIAATFLLLVFAAGCTTSYDAYGRPQQTVDPGIALLGVAAAGVAGYALANNHNDCHDRYDRHARYNRHDYRYNACHETYYRPPRRGYCY